MRPAIFLLILFSDVMFATDITIPLGMRHFTNYRDLWLFKFVVEEDTIQANIVISTLVTAPYCSAKNITL